KQYPILCRKSAISEERAVSGGSGTGRYSLRSPATAWAEGGQFNGPPSPCADTADRAGPSVAPTAPEHILLDINQLAAGKAFMAVGAGALSENDRFYAFTTDATGFRQYTLRIKDLHTGKLLRGRRQRVTSVAWAADNQALFYTTEDKVTKRSNQLWKHTLGQRRDTLVYEEKDERSRLLVHRPRSRAYLLLSSDSPTASEVRSLPANRPHGRWRLVRPRRANIEYDVDHHGDRFYIRINDTGHNFRLVSAPI